DYYCQSYDSSQSMFF
nr:immunoglobulin light chain junction region [Macaca mulatta]MOY09900.1 immunoglobulin light chain junction region [Macaca mulatta]